MSDNTLSKDEIVVQRIFNAPIDLIWRLWTQPEHFKSWYGPQGLSVPVAEMDVRVGGKRLVCMERQTPNGSMKMWTTGEYLEVVPNQRLVYTDSFADEHGNVVLPSALGMNDGEHPATTKVTVLLEELDGRTQMTMTHTGIPANEQGASAGWQQAFDKMEAYIETTANAN